MKKIFEIMKDLCYNFSCIKKKYNIHKENGNFMKLYKLKINLLKFI